MLKRNKKLASRLLAALMALACVLTLLPGAAMAAGEDDGGKMVVDKTATLEDDGTYTINLSAYATGQTTTETIKTGKPLDIVLVLDQSGSMADSITSYSYQARTSQGYSYSGYGSSEYYYLDEDGNYYRVSRGSEEHGLLWWKYTTYYLYYTKNGQTYYLSGTGVTTQRPTNVQDASTTIWTGVLYQRSSTTTSKLDALKAAVTNFVNSVSANAKEFNVDHQIALVGFASNEGDGKSDKGSVSYGSSDEYWVNTGLFVNGQLKNYKTYRYGYGGWNSLTAQDYWNALVSVNTNGSITQSITTAISRIADSGGTRTSYGLEMAQNVFANNPIPAGSDRQRVVVLFTDGEPGQSEYNSTEANKAISEAHTLKNTHNAKVYTVGLYDNDPSSNVTNFMNYTSSNYPSAQSTNNHGDKVDDKYYMTASDADELNKIFTNIVEDSTESSTTVTLDAESVLRDILNDGFVLPAGYNAQDNITVATKPGQMDEAGNISWGEIQENPSGITATADEETGTIEVTGFDYSSRYIAKSHSGDMLLVTIRGVEATDAAITNAEISTNDAASGIYENADNEEPFVRFPEPKTILKSKTYVLDYGKSVNLNAQDWGIGSISTLNGDGMHRFYSPVWNLTEDHGKVSATQSGLTYTPTTMNWDGYDNLYVFGKQIAEDGAENQWSRVTVMPANSVYYEDTFVTDSNTGKVGIEYTGDWEQVGTSGGNTQTVDDGQPYGWEESYDDITFSDGCAHCVTASDDDEVAQASFTFTGTGVDVYSRTNMTTGTVYAVLEPQFESENAKVQRLIVDHLAVSGDYYQIPTVSFQNLEYGEYKVTVMVTTAAEGRSTYYLDGVRVYNPIQDLEEDQLVQDAYGADHELNAVFQEVRDILVTQANLPEGDELPNNSVVFIDQVDGEIGGETSVVGTYVEYGPKTEVYLAPGQSIAFQVATGSNSHYYLGLKGPAGATQAEATSGTGKMQIEICGSCDMYYEVTPNADGIVMVKNTGENLLSITKLRTTSDSEDENASIVGASVSELLAYADTFDSLEVVEYPTDLGDVEIENPDVQELGDGSVAWEWLQKIFRGIWDLLRP